MSTGIRMVFSLFLLSATLIHSNQEIAPLQTIKISENVTYDCIDIYKQPGLDHPLLKGHTIQMKPSVSIQALKNQTDNNTYKKTLRCLEGTVPILRISKEHINNAQLFAEKYFHPLSGPGTHVAGVRSRKGPYHGVGARLSGYRLDVGRDQASFSQIYVGNDINQDNFIQVGLMNNPGISGDGRLWSYGYWKGKDGIGCYNTACPGFVQVSREVPIAVPVEQPKEGYLRYSINQDKVKGNWWLTQLIQDKPNIEIGYWPKELFNLIDNGANMVGVGGMVQVSRSGSSPPMGNGNFPTKDSKQSAIFANIEVLNSNYEQSRMDSFPIENLLDGSKCYGLRIGDAGWFDPDHKLGFFFNYGGPGGNSC